MIRKILPAVFVILCLAWNAHAADDLLRAVPRDAVVVARVRNLHALWNKFYESAAFNRIENAPITELRQGIARARDEIAAFEQQTGLNVELGLASIFGTDAALVMFPDKTGAFIARSADPDRMVQAVGMIETIERGEGKYVEEHVVFYKDVEISSFRIQKPLAPVETARNRSHAIAGDVLIVSESPDAVRRVIDVVQAGAPPLAEAEEYAMAMKQVRPDAFATLYLDTDRLATVEDIEGFLAGKLKNPAAKLLLARAKSILAVTRYVVSEIATQPDGLVMDYTIVYDEEAAKEGYGDLFPAEGAPLDIVRLAPSDAVFFLANQCDKTALWKRIVEMTTDTMPEAAEDIRTGADQLAQMVGNLYFETELLGQLGDQAALIVLAGPGPDDPPAAALALEMKPGATLPVSLRAVIGFAAGVARAEADKEGTEATVDAERWTYRNTNLDTLILKEPKLKGKLNPTLFAKDKFLVVATTPDCARAVLDAYAAEEVKPATAEGLTTTGQARLNVPAIAALIEKHRAFLVAEAVKDGKTVEKAENDLIALRFLLGFLRRIELRGVYAPGRFTRAMEVLFDPAR